MERKAQVEVSKMEMELTKKEKEENRVSLHFIILSA